MLLRPPGPSADRRTGASSSWGDRSHVGVGPRSLAPRVARARSDHEQGPRPHLRVPASNPRRPPPPPGLLDNVDTAGPNDYLGSGAFSPPPGANGDDFVNSGGPFGEAGSDGVRPASNGANSSAPQQEAKAAGSTSGSGPSQKPPRRRWVPQPGDDTIDAIPPNPYTPYDGYGSTPYGNSTDSYASAPRPEVGPGGRGGWDEPPATGEGSSGPGGGPATTPSSAGRSFTPSSAAGAFAADSRFQPERSEQLQGPAAAGPGPGPSPGQSQAGGREGSLPEDSPALLGWGVVSDDWGDVPVLSDWGGGPMQSADTGWDDASRGGPSAGSRAGPGGSGAAGPDASAAQQWPAPPPGGAGAPSSSSADDGAAYSARQPYGSNPYDSSYDGWDQRSVPFTEDVRYGYGSAAGAPGAGPAGPGAAYGSPSATEWGAGPTGPGQAQAPPGSGWAQAAAGGGAGAAGAGPYGVLPPSDIVLLSGRDVSGILPLAPTPGQVDYFQPRSVTERIVQLLGSVGASVLLSKAALLATPALLYPIWSPWVRAGLRNVDLAAKGYAAIGLWRAQVIEVSVAGAGLGSALGLGLGLRGPPLVSLLVGDPWQGGGRASLDLPYQPRAEYVRPGDCVELLVLGRDERFSSFKVVREVYLPQAGVWLCDYPFLNRDLFTAVSVAIEQERRAAEAAAAGWPAGSGGASAGGGGPGPSASYYNTYDVAYDVRDVRYHNGPDVYDAGPMYGAGGSTAGAGAGPGANAEAGWGAGGAGTGAGAGMGGESAGPKPGAGTARGAGETGWGSGGGAARAPGPAGWSGEWSGFDS
ncbi:hypothetical protein HYH03_013966 [Edaphochlamys debaryana]|uniref:Uncharacterized protein n=1 Tax=Edaphochlamys debaryana TaxID=47281 RepID=A0A835XM60_9CHLO|nr:hypothetical protein HYH03_013966 [Edaphochlamys debaryana]|eukprot:KAG2487397.1 hypothetical protein HYH03_013966 [Edaphochlamys debaryana]